MTLGLIYFVCDRIGLFNRFLHSDHSSSKMTKHGYDETMELQFKTNNNLDKPNYNGQTIGLAW
tara:strand:+ start:1083 stop:1271 length:189 start_codon:yes stop_codon:yes gene_type:complete